MSEEVLRQLLPVISSLLFLPAVFIPLAAVVVYSARATDRERERVEQLATRLRRLCESTGRPAIRTRRPRRVSLDAHMGGARTLERSLLSLERDHGIRSRRLPHYRSKSLIHDLEKRIARLEERGLH